MNTGIIKLPAPTHIPTRRAYSIKIKDVLSNKMLDDRVQLFKCVVSIPNINRAKINAATFGANATPNHPNT